MNAKASPEATRALVAQRAEARWNAVIKGDYKGAYAYFSPASRAVVTEQQFESRRRRVSFRSVRIDSVQCAENSCDVKLTLTYDLKEIKGMPAPIEEAWIFEHGQAWYVYRS